MSALQPPPDGLDRSPAQGRSKRLNPRVAAYVLLFAAVIALGVYAAHIGEAAPNWRDIDAHYAQLGGADESDARYDAALCDAFAHSLRLNKNAFARHPTILSGAQSRIYLADEYARHCEASP